MHISFNVVANFNNRYRILYVEIGLIYIHCGVISPYPIRDLENRKPHSLVKEVDVEVTV